MNMKPRFSNSPNSVMIFSIRHDLLHFECFLYCPKVNESMSFTMEAGVTE
jgi:hypothetical protein